MDLMGNLHSKNLYKKYFRLKMLSQGNPVSICDPLIMSKQILRGFWVTERYKYQIVSKSSKKFVDLNIGVQGNLSFWKIVYTIVYLLLSVAWKKFFIKIPIIMTNCFCGMVNRRKVFSLTYRGYNCQGFSPTRCEQDFFVEWRRAVVITTALQRNLKKCFS